MEKILHILPMNGFGGAENLVRLICSNNKYYHPIVITGGKKLEKIFRGHDIETYSIDFLPKNIINNIKTLSLIIKKNDIKIIHAHDNKASIYAYLCKKFLNNELRIISHIHSCYPWLSTKSMYYYIDHFLRPKFNMNLVCGKSVLEYFEKYAKYSVSPSFYILPNAVNVQDISLKAQEPLSIKNLNIGNDDFVFGFIGRLTDAKGLIPFIKTVKKYEEKFTGCKILIVGGGELESEIKNLLKELEISELFILTGFQKDVVKYYSMMDLFFIPSKYEGLPMVLLEAMSTKLPVISMNVGGIGDVIEHEKSGELIEKGDYDKFVLSLIDLKNNEQLRNGYSIEGYKKAKDYYDISYYINKLEQIYSNL